MPDSAPAGRLAPWAYDESAARADLDALDALLAAQSDLSEREDILPQHLYCCTFDELLRDLRWKARWHPWVREIAPPAR